MPFKSGMRARQFTEQQLRHMLVLPAVRLLRAFVAFHRDRVSVRQIAEETGQRLNSLYICFSRARRAIGLRKIPILRGKSRTVHAFDSELNIRSELHIDNQCYAWSSAVETAAKDYFLANALRRYEIARLLWVERLSYAEVGRKLGVPASVAHSTLRTVHKIAAGKRRLRVYPRTQQRSLAHGHSRSVRASHPASGRPA